MGYINFEEGEPALFEAAIQDNAQRGEGTFFRVEGCLGPQFALIQKGPEEKSVTVDIPRTLKALDVDRIIICLQAYREQMSP